ncbi:MAG: hypothetical protein AB7D38_02965 [Sulfurimonas sp.]|uniref:relaxase/mobilization nuclease domain-containing protein n=1 Tax=Sulfurimonas sp. TaxID=2022749 RepID=UPI003D0FF76B
MINCPPGMPFYECLKRQMASKQGSIVSSSSQSSSSFSKPVISTHSYSSGGSHHSFGASHSASIGGSSSFHMSFGKNSTTTASQNNSSSITNNTSKGGVIVNKQTVIVKSNFEMAGRLNKQGKRNNAKTLGFHASASLTYMENHGAKDLESNQALSNIYDEDGERMRKDEYEKLKQDLNAGVHAFRRTVIDVGQSDLDRDDINRLVRESLQEFQEKSGKKFEYAYAIHTDTDNIHAHVLSHGKSHEINMTKEHLQLFKQTVGEKTNELLQEQKLENERDRSFEKQMDQSNNKENQNSLSI